MILKKLIPYPEGIDLNRIRQFKEKHYELLSRFRNQVELIVLDSAIDPDSPLFRERLEEMNEHKQELLAAMNSCKFGNIFFGTICGMVAAGVSLLNDSVYTAIPGFLHAIYSALKIERPEDVRDQTGLKYLALVDKQMRRKIKK